MAAKPGGTQGRQRRQQRDDRITAGAAELERRLADALGPGLAEAAADPRSLSEPAARMVDAQAPGLAARLRELATIPSSGPDWPDRLLEEYALLHLLAVGYGRLGALPAPLAATVSTRVGRPTPTAEVLATGPRLRDRWLVLGRTETGEGPPRQPQQSQSQPAAQRPGARQSTAQRPTAQQSPHRLTARRTWLLGRSSGRIALLLAYAGPGRPMPGPLLPVGRELAAEVAYYPSALPLRAVLADPAEPIAEDAADAGPPPGRSLTEALADYTAALAADPWTDRIPVVLREVVCRPGPEGWLITEPTGARSVPVDGRYAVDTGLWRLTAVGAGRPLTVFGELGHRGFAPVTCWARHPEPSPVPVHR
ncbi:hypothetical protein [Phaeacidiphilus oryzae]|uniref:hypothetical protein n=1 Tax=Phaeacidiphilus oryzae TaxID=348818 RepID=UPI00068A434A|nr:hypothetical protein [Phaeacidiphilus oryzae]